MVELDKQDMDEFAAFHASQGASEAADNVAARFRRQDKVLVALLVVMLLALLVVLLLVAIPLLNLVLGFLGINWGFLQNLNAWWVAGWQGAWWTLGAGAVALLTAVAGRQRVLNNPSLYYEAGCPQCQEHDLFRVSRYRRDRLLAAFGFPIRRYVCRNCTWQGTRLAGLDPALYVRWHDTLAGEPSDY